MQIRQLRPAFDDDTRTPVAGWSSSELVVHRLAFWSVPTTPLDISVPPKHLPDEATFFNAFDRAGAEQTGSIASGYDVIWWLSAENIVHIPEPKMTMLRYLKFSELVNTAKVLDRRRHSLQHELTHLELGLILDEAHATGCADRQPVTEPTITSEPNSSSASTLPRALSEPARAYLHALVSLITKTVTALWAAIRAALATVQGDSLRFLPLVLRVCRHHRHRHEPAGDHLPHAHQVRFLVGVATA